MVDKSVGVQCETVELTTARDQTDENDDAGVRTSLEAQRQCPVVGHEAGPLETMHTNVAASNGSSTATVELRLEASDGEDSESDAPCTPELDTVSDALVELAGEDGCDWVLVCWKQV